MAAEKPLSLVAEWTRAGMRETQSSRPLWMVLQFFQGWSRDRWPSGEELRTMSIMAIAEGARGIFYWSFGARALMSVSNPEQREEYWQRLVAVLRELKSLEPALVADDAPQAVRAVSEPRLRWRARLVGGRCYVFAYLPSDRFVSKPSASSNVSVRFDMATGKTVTRMFRPDSGDWFVVP